MLMLPRSLASLLIAFSLTLSTYALNLFPRQGSAPVTYDQIVRNITIDNYLMTASSQSVYGTSLLGYVSFYLSGNWSTVVSPQFAYAGSYLWTTDPDAKAVLTFKGIAAYFYSPRFTSTAIFQRVSVNIQLDTEPLHFVNLSAPALSSQGTPVNTSLPSAAVWGHPGLSYGEHTLTVTMGSGAQYAVLDALVYTAVVEDPPSVSPSSTPSTSSAASSPSSNMSTLRIAMTTTFSIIAALIILGAFLFFRRRKMQKESRAANSGRLRRWVDTRWINASRTNLSAGGGGVGVGDVKDGEVVRMEKL